MLERQIEDLIAAYPEEFFPGHTLVLKKRQGVFAGVGRFDLLFADRYSTNVLMELKAVPAKYEHATQLAKYKEALEAKGECNILMWLVAPSIPTAVREFMDRVGIEYTEIHETQFRRVAEKYGVPIVAAQEMSAPLKVRNVHDSPEKTHTSDASWDDYKLLPTINKQNLDELVQDFESAVKRRIDRSLAVRLRQEILDPENPALNRSTILQLARWCKTENPLYWGGMAVAQKISNALFGTVLDRKRLGT
jgi:endonuclease NucS-like protein